MKSVVARTGFFAWVVSGAVLSLVAAQLEWMTDAQQALAKAKTEQKLVLLNFTGSDWCPPCIRLEKEVLSTPEFAGYARTNLVLVMVDFPRKKQLPKQQSEANKALAEKYGVEGLPTLVVLDSTGKQLGALGYMPGGPGRFIAQLEKLRAKAARATQAASASESKPQSAETGR